MDNLDFGWGMRSITPRKNLFKIDTYKSSDQGRKRFKWMEYYEIHKNAAQTYRHFDIPLKSFWKWRKRFLEEGVIGLEDQVRRPEHFREREIPSQTIALIAKIREANPCSLEQQNKRIVAWNEYYNYKRYHRSLGCLTPAQYLATLNLPHRHLYPNNDLFILCLYDM